MPHECDSIVERGLSNLNFADILQLTELTAIHDTNKNLTYTINFRYYWISWFGIPADQRREQS